MLLEHPFTYQHQLVLFRTLPGVLSPPRLLGLLSTLGFSFGSYFICFGIPVFLYILLSPLEDDLSLLLVGLS